MSPITFATVGAPPPLIERLARRGITQPTAIQAATIPDALAGRDVSGRAPTGSGKTIAFGIPLVSRVGSGAPRRPRGLVLVPTRELASQVAGELTELAGRRGPSVLAIFGGVGFGPQIAGLRRGVDIVVACPGRLTDLVNRNEIQLDDIELVVVDEADRMADMGFLPEVRRLLDGVRVDRQTLLFSATLDGAVRVLVERYQRGPVVHDVVSTTDDDRNTRHVFWTVKRPDRVAVVTDLVATRWPAIVFCRTKHGADRLAKHLARGGVAAGALHGDRTQAQRDRTLAAFSNGALQVLVATDVAARGIHVDDVEAVVHYDPPSTEKDYVHRSGRTGRAGRTGLVISLVEPEQRRHVSQQQRALGRALELQVPDVRPAPKPGSPARALDTRRTARRRRRR